MATAIAKMIGGAIVSAVAFTGGNYLFSKLGRDDNIAPQNARDTIKRLKHYNRLKLLGLKNERSV